MAMTGEELDRAWEGIRETLEAERRREAEERRAAEEDAGAIASFTPPCRPRTVST